MTRPNITPAHVTTAILVACLAYLWANATPGGRDLIAGLGAVACTVVLMWIVVRRSV